MTPERLRASLRIAAFAGFGAAVFLVAFYLFFPFDRIKDQAIAMAAARKVDLQIGSAGPTFGFGVKFKDIEWKTQPPDGSKPSQGRAQRVSVQVPPLARLAGEAAYDISADIFDGSIDVGWRQSKTQGALKIHAADLALASLPGVKETINLPLGGTLNLHMDFSLPANRYAQGGGTFEWLCSACSVGDGKEKLKIPGNALLAEGITVPKIRLGDFAGKIVFSQGEGKITGGHAKSPDGELFLEGEVRMADPLDRSYVDIYVSFRVSDALLKSSDRIGLLLQLAESSGKRPDGYFGFRLTGTLAHMVAPQWSKTSPFGPAVPAGTRSGGHPSAARSPPPVAQPTLPIVRAVEETIDPAKNPGANLPAYPSLPPPSEPQAAPTAE